MTTIKTKGRPRNFANFELKQAYTSNLKIPAAKVKDLLCLCKKGLIPSAYHNFYNGLIASDSNNNATCNSDDD